MSRKTVKVLFLIIFFSITGVAFAQAGLAGVHGISWGTVFTEVLDHFRSLAKDPNNAKKTTILNVQTDREILTERDGIKYRYAFYKKPPIVLKEGASETSEATGFDSMAEEGTDVIPPEAPETTKASEVKNPARFFFMEATFPYVPSFDLKAKLTEKYGDPTITKFEKAGNGAYVWEMNTGYIIQWVDIYDGKPFTRSIYYVSKEIMEEIGRDFEKYQYTREIDTLRRIIP